VDEHPVPSKEIRRVVDVESVIDVSCHILVVPRLDARVVRRFGSSHVSGRQLHEASRRRREALACRCVQRPPFLSLLRDLVCAVRRGNAVTNRVPVSGVVLHVLQCHSRDIVESRAVGDLLGGVVAGLWRLGTRHPDLR